MSILDDAIREHLELKRAHGADEAELKRLEDEAFGPPGRPEEPDPLAEAPTEFMATPGAEAPAEDSGRRRINVADLQEPPPPKPSGEAAQAQVESAAAIEPEPDPGPIAPAEDPVQAAPPAEESIVEPEPELEPGETETAPVEEPTPDGEQQAIAEQPTELFDVEAEMGSEDAPVIEAPIPSDEQIAEAASSAPKLAPADPPTEIHASRAPAPAEPEVEDEEDEEFWSEQRLSDELDQALEAPPVEEKEDEEKAHADYDPDTGHEDVLEDTPEFLEDAPEDDELWFEQKPPKDFDFDD